MFHSAFANDTEEVVLLEVKGLIKITVKFRAKKNVLCTFLSPNVLLRGMKCWLRKQLCSFENEKLISFSCSIWLIISEKILQDACFFTVVHACTKSLNEAYKKCGLAVFIDEHGYILTEECRSFKTFLKENNAIALDSNDKCYTLNRTWCW